MVVIDHPLSPFVEADPVTSPVNFISLFELNFVAVVAFPVVETLVVPVSLAAFKELLAVSGVIVLLPSVITPFAIFASVIPYPLNVVGLVPAVTCP